MYCVVRQKNHGYAFVYLEQHVTPGHVKLAEFADRDWAVGFRDYYNNHARGDLNADADKLLTEYQTLHKNRPMPDPIAERDPAVMSESTTPQQMVDRAEQLARSLRELPIPDRREELNKIRRENVVMYALVRGKLRQGHVDE